MKKDKKDFLSEEEVGIGGTACHNVPTKGDASACHKREHLNGPALGYEAADVLNLGVEVKFPH